MIGIELTAYVACAAAAVWLVYRYDLYDREPWPLVLATASAGAVLMWWLSGVQDAVLARLAGTSASPYPLALVAAATEEPARLVIVVSLAALVPRFFNDPMDGLVYGSIAGIGMALEETRAILSQSPAPSAFLPVELVRVSGHLVLGGITGFGVGVAKRPGVSTGGWVTALAACLAGSMLLHFLWDVAALTQTLSGGLATWPALAGSAVMLAGMIVYGALVVTGARWSRQRFAPNSLRTLWGWPLDRVRQRTR